jgi:hypothetical protein
MYSPAEHTAGRLVMADHLQKKTKKETFVSIVTERMGTQRQFQGLHGDLLKICSNSGQMKLTW